MAAPPLTSAPPLAGALPGPGRFRRVLATMGAVSGITLVFTSALVVSVAVHLDLAPTRRVVRSIANLVLGGTFKGAIVVGEIEQLNLHGLAVRSATALDPSGTPVARLDGLRARTDVLAIARSALFGGGQIRVPIPLVHVDRADIALDRGPAGVPAIAETFILRKPAPPPPPSAVAPLVTLDRIEIDHVSVHGAVAPPTAVDAELAHVAASVKVSAEGVAVDVAPVRLDARAPVPQPLAGDVRFHLHVPPAKGGVPQGEMRMEAGFDGRLGPLDLKLGATMEGQHVSAKVEVPRATPAAIASFLPDPSTKLPLRVPAAVVVTADGDLPELLLDAKVDLEGGGGLAAGGKLSLGPPVVLDLGFSVRQLDPRVVIEVPSATPLDAAGHVRLSLGGELSIHADATTQPLQIAGNPIPKLTAQAALEHGVWRGNANVDEAGAPTSASFSFEKEELRFEVESQAASLRAIRRLGAPVDGSARVKVAGSLKGGALDATVTGRVGAIRAPGGVELEDGTLDARVRGPVAAPTVDATVRGRGMRAGPYAWETVTARAAGPLTGGGGLRVETNLDTGGGESIAASGALDPRSKSLRDVEVDIKRRDGEVKGKLAKVASGPSGILIDGLALHGDGVGDLEGTLTVKGQELVGKLHGHNVDLARVARMAALKQHLAGLANVDVDLSSSRPGDRRGHIALELVNGEVSALSGLSGLVSATFEGEQVRLDGLLRLVAHADAREKRDERCDGAIASIRVTGGDGTLAGPLLDPATWERASGKVEVAAEDWNLRCLARLAPPLRLVVSDVRGKLTTRATIERKPGASLPSVRALLARTRGLELVGPEDRDGPEWESRSMDVELKGSFDAASGVAGAKLTLLDGSEIASIGGRATIDPAALLDHPDKRAEMLRAAPIEAHVTIPRRAVGAFGTLPSFVRDSLPPLAGEVQVDGTIQGTLARPHVEVHAGGWGLAHAYGVTPAEDPHRKPGKAGEVVARTPPRESPWSLPLDLDATLSYDGERAKVDAHVKRDDQELVTAGADLALALSDVLSGRPVRPKGGLTAKLAHVPFGEIPFFSDRGIDGHLDGSIAVTGLGDKPAIKAALDIPDLKVGHDLAYDTATVRLDVGGPPSSSSGNGSATARFVLSSKTGGKLLASASSNVLWKNGLVPAIDPARPADASVRAERFRIAVLAPFVAGLLSRIDGTLDGDARLGWKNLDAADKAKIDVQLKLADGMFHVPQLGQELHGAEVEVKSVPGGRILLQGLRAYGTKGQIAGSGEARFDGLRFLGADAELGIKAGEEMPIMLEGVPFGDAHGKVTVHAEKRANELAVTVGIPRLHVDLPSSTGRGVQALDDNPDIEIAQEGKRAKDAAPADPTRLALTFDIGEISVKGNMLDVALAGVKQAPLRVEVAEKSRISGDIRLARGRLEVLHKQFEIEQGVVHMRPEDPGNPYVSVTARWDSPEGPIYIDYAGVLLPIAPEKIKYRSPSIPEDKIMATLLFGGVEQSTLGAGSSAGVPGQSLAAQLIAQQFSTQIAGNISTSIGANDDGTFRPGLVYNSGDKVIELSTYGASGQGSSGAAALKGQRTQITVDWRFWRNWLLRGRVDVGSDQQTTGVDVLWQYRY